MQILTSSCVSPWQCPCQIRGPLCSVDLCLPVARRPEAFWEMPRMTLAEGPCSQLLEKWSPGEGRGKERSPWYGPLPKGNLLLKTGMALAFQESPLPGWKPVCPCPWGQGIPRLVTAALWCGATSTHPCVSLTLLPCGHLWGQSQCSAQTVPSQRLIHTLSLFLLLLLCSPLSASEVTLGHPTREPLCTICLVMTAVAPHMR